MRIPGQIDFFSARGINSIDDYKRFYHTRAYIRQKARAGDPRYKQDSRLLPFFKEIAEKTGYKNFSKFLMRKTAWDNLEGPIPLTYLDAINAEREVLALTQEADNDEFEQALALPRFPKYADGRVEEILYPPRLDFMKTHAVPVRDGSRIGISRVG